MSNAESLSRDAAVILGTELLDNRHSGDRKKERALMRSVLERLVTNPDPPAPPAHGGTAYLFGHLKESVRVTSLAALKAQTGISSGPLYEQVYRIFSLRPEVKVVEIWPTNIR